MSSTPGALHSSAGHKRPTTPLRRVSRNSLRALSLSHSRNRVTGGAADEHQDGDDATAHDGAMGSGGALGGQQPLSYLAPVFVELADAMADLATNVEQLEDVHASLSSFNNAFGAFLYGLRMNCYTSEFLDAPNKLNFDLHAQRRAEQAANAPPATPSPSAPHRGGLSTLSPDSPTGDASMREWDTTFHTNDDMSRLRADFDDPPARQSTSTRGGASTRGRGTTTRGRGGGAAAAKTRAAAAKKRKDENLAFAGKLIQHLPIKFREQQPQRSEMETVIGLLRDNSDGLAMGDFKSLSNVPQHRVNDALLELVRAKHALKHTGTAKGTMFQLDPTRYPPS